MGTVQIRVQRNSVTYGHPVCNIYTFVTICKMFAKTSLLVFSAVLLAAVVQGKPQAKADCFTVGFAYGGEDILTAGWHNIQASAEACQISCQAITDCKFFTFFTSGPSQGYCELKYADGEYLFQKPPLDPENVYKFDFKK